MTDSETEIRAKISRRLSLAIEVWRGENSWKSGSRSKPAAYRDLAKVLDVDPGLISCWRQGKAWPRLSKIGLVAKTLGVPIDWFWADSPHPRQRKQQKVAKS